ncbi:M14 family zinc carboxypeptidase [Aldersonia sp. NBC_00410]|uniref:M14 family zinc carboxypeptidase n=1 Tax=Aldersonia sp. NBC_00410 TaxID=2975954 RepID=UPI00224F2A84|nr:M14 family zinc carboxypeptidase [Aldersonia sp. NBC_00410]MCX5042137.1 M14 family zinc carboxypeptidase [Aldersonia sp. NBC_00410]
MSEPIDPSDTRISARITAPDRETAFDIVRRYPLDYGCRPVALPTDRGFEVPALLSPTDLDTLRDAGIEVDIRFDVRDRDNAPIGTGDRFEGGQRAPQGVGTRREGQGDDVGPILNVDEIGSAIDGLVNEYGIPTFTLPNGTAEGRPSTGGQIGDVDPDLYHVYFTAGVHARERGGPDALIYFIADLLHANKFGTGITFGARSYSNADVHKALNTGIVFFPLVNPDGVAWDQRTDTLWRKNRNPASAIPGSAKSIGVDINRNYDFLWDYRTHFDPSITGNSALASDDPSAETFHGTAPFSEPETRNVGWVFDRFPRLNWYMDIHSAVGDILYNWGDDDDQVGDEGMRFFDPRWDGARGVLTTNDYREWLPEADLGRIKNVARRTAAAMAAVGGRPFRPIPAADLYATSGASDDYAYSRSWINPDHSKAHGFTMEFGYPTNFYPTLTEYHQNLADVGAGLMEFCLAAADHPV